jgi:hypothetical protein
MTTRTVLTTLALATVLAAASGCGESKGLSRAELIAKADPICRRTNDKLDSNPLTLQNVARIAPEAAAYEKQSAAELAKLAPPASMARDWKAIVDGFQITGEDLAKVGEYAKVKNLKAAVLSAAKLSNAQHDRAVTASRNGFKDCSRY